MKHKLLLMVLVLAVPILGQYPLSPYAPGSGPTSEFKLNTPITKDGVTLMFKGVPIDEPPKDWHLPWNPPREMGLAVCVASKKLDTFGYRLSFRLTPESGSLMQWVVLSRFMPEFTLYSKDPIEAPFACQVMWNPKRVEDILSVVVEELRPAGGIQF